MKTKVIKNKVAEFKQAMNIYKPQWVADILFLLQQEKKLLNVEIERTLGISPAQVKIKLDHLYKYGLIEKIKIEGTDKKFYYQLSEEGNRALKSEVNAMIKRYRLYKTRMLWRKKP